MKDQNKRLVRTGVVATEFGVNRRTVQRWALQGKLPYQRIGTGHRRYDLATIKALRDRAQQREVGHGA